MSSTHPLRNIDATAQTTLENLRICAVSTALFCSFFSVFALQFTGKDTDVYLYKVVGGGTTTYYATGGAALFGCSKPVHIVNAALAMGILAWLAAAVGMVAAIFVRLKIQLPIARALPTVGFASCAAATAFHILSLIFTVCFYRGKFCDSTESYDATTSIAIGFGFLVVVVLVDVTWGASLLASPQVLRAFVMPATTSSDTHREDGSIPCDTAQVDIYN